MAARRRCRRGYNQAEVLARIVAGQLERPFEAGLRERVRGTEQQARQADLQARQANVRGAFRADRELVGGGRILVDDDVTTSGATLNACAEALLAAGATSVLAWALARED
jgi:predicted amidophosphoribosyltransferase